MKPVFCLLITILAAVPGRTQSLDSSFAVTFGPVIHWNWDEPESKWSIGAEVAVWYGRWPCGLDLGLEREDGRFRYYLEVETIALRASLFKDILWFGASLGFAGEFSQREGEHYGWQASFWNQTAYGPGFDFRYKRLRGENILSLGGSYKVPLNYLGRLLRSDSTLTLTSQ